MDAQALKEHIINNDLIPVVLESLGCHHIKYHEDYYSCGNPDGDNPASVNIYTSTLAVVNYTRDLDSVSKYHDIFTLIQFYKGINFFDAIKYVCDCIGISIYYNFDKELPESLVLTRELLKMIDEDESQEDEKPIIPIPEQIINYYPVCVNDQFLRDYIPYHVQIYFEIGYDQDSNRITIPIRNYDGALLGIKGRYFGDIPEGSDIQKYTYIEPCNKSQVLFGLNKSLHIIEESHIAFVGESEKFVMQLWAYGDKNCVATGGKTISKQQIELLSRLCDKVILCLDKDVKENELENIASKFLGMVQVYTIDDIDGLLDKKESPSDNPDKWHKLKNHLKRIK